jgi:endonuclease YncB( thermonuclease family)
MATMSGYNSVLPPKISIPNSVSTTMQPIKSITQGKQHDKQPSISLLDKLFHLIHIGRYEKEDTEGQLKPLPLQDEEQGLGAVPYSDTCLLNKSGKVLFTPNSVNPEDIPDEIIDKMCNFHLTGLSGKGKIRHIIDGDTYDLFMYVPLSNLSVSQKVIKYRKEYEVIPILTQNDNAGFFGLFRCRAFGYDSAEKITERGQVAKKVLTDKLASLSPPNVVWYRAGGFDKYGRLLVELFEDANRTKSINMYMVNYRDPRWGAVSLEYGGGTKDESFKGEEATAREASHHKVKGSKKPIVTGPLVGPLSIHIPSHTPSTLVITHPVSPVRSKPIPSQPIISTPSVTSRPAISIPSVPVGTPSRPPIVQMPVGVAPKPVFNIPKPTTVSTQSISTPSQAQYPIVQHQMVQIVPAITSPAPVNTTKPHKKHGFLSRLFGSSDD